MIDPELAARITLLLESMTEENSTALLVEFWYEAQARIAQALRMDVLG